MIFIDKLKSEPRIRVQQALMQKEKRDEGKLNLNFINLIIKVAYKKNLTFDFFVFFWLEFF